MFSKKIEQAQKIIQNLVYKVNKNNLDCLEREINYFESNKERTHYFEYRNKGFPIGRGMIESTQTSCL